MIQIDYSRVTAEITKQEERLNKMADFLQQRATKLASAASDIETLLAKHKCVLPEFSNAYSAGGFDSDLYAANMPMVVHGSAVLTEGIKNIEKHAAIVRRAWFENIAEKYSIKADYFAVKGGKLTFTIWVY